MINHNSRGSFTAEDVTARLRAKNNPPLGVYARLIAANAAAQRVHRLAFSALNAYAAQSPEESVMALRAVDFACDSLSQHVEHALIAIGDEVTT